MLKGIPKNVSPELLKVLCEMGHGDEIVIADANFPSTSIAKVLVRLDGQSGEKVLDSVLKLSPLDTYAPSNMMYMETTAGDPTPEIWESYEKIANKRDKNVKISQIERQAFYDRARKAYAVIATGEEKIYANVIIKKGVIK